MTPTSGFEREKPPCERANAISSSAKLPAFSFELQDKKIGQDVIVSNIRETQLCKHEIGCKGCDNDYSHMCHEMGDGKVMR